MRNVLWTRGTAVAALFALAAAACTTSVDTGENGERGTETEAAPRTSDPLVEPEMLKALQRDLGLTAEQVTRRLAAEATAARIEPGLRDQLGESFGGAWMDKDGARLIVGITDPALAEGVRAAGAEPQIVARNLARLDAIKAKLDERAQRSANGIHSWRVDVTTNTVLVDAADPDAPATRAFVDSLEAVHVIRSSERPRPLYDLRGGDEYIINSNTLCSVGFSVNGGFVTAGHCGKAGSPTAGSNWVAQGTFRGSTFPGNDYAWVEINGSWNSFPQVTNYAGGAVSVLGSQVASVGSSVCRSGRTSHWHCGTIQATNVTINYAAGPVYGATQTNACAEGGDSGGSFISGNQAQGVTSGGSGDCSTGGQTFFQPVNPILSVYGLTLKTDGGGQGIGSRLNDKCIDVPGSNFVDGARLQMYTCNGTGAQQWAAVDGTFRAGGKCMDVAGANTADGTPIQLVNCNGNRAQQFVLNAAGDLVSLLANKCVDIDAWNRNDGARLIIWPCHGGANQKWYRR
jgi:streptogrisin C